MNTYLLSQLRHRPGRSASLALGILVAAVGFTLLTSTVSTSQLRVVGTVSKHFRPAYDILVRPSGSFTTLEKARHLVQSNYLSGVFGGISFEQYRAIRHIPGVEVSAPIANIGWILPFQPIPIPISRFLSDDNVQMYKLRVDWLANHDHSRYPDAVRYIYFTRTNRFIDIGNGLVAEVLPSGAKAPACLPFVLSRDRRLLTSDPFSVSADTSMTCFSARTPRRQWPLSDQGALKGHRVGEWAFVYYPMLLAAIDPAEEERLVDLSATVVSGRALSARDEVQRERDPGGLTFKTVPILVSERTYLDETLQVVVERLDVPSDPILHRSLASETRSFPFVRHLKEHEVGRLEIPAQEIYEFYLRTLEAAAARKRITYDGYWTSSSIDYRTDASGSLLPITRRNERGIFETAFGPGWAPLDNRDIQFRELRRHAGSVTVTDSFLQPSFRVVGHFDPELLPGFSPLSEVPLETYYPPRVAPASARSREALAYGDLLPSMNLGGYVSQPPLMLTNLRGLKAFVDARAFEGVPEREPISVVRVRVEGVTGPDALSRERIRRVAELIHERTGLAVDITAGSSPRSLLVQLPAGRFGQPELLVRENWVEKGVAVRFLKALDRKSLALFLLILLVSGFFLCNGALASVRARRTEIGTLMSLGWSRRTIFAAVLEELLAVGLFAGLAGAGLAALLGEALDLEASPLRALLVVPTAMVLAAASGIIPAWRASRGIPLDAVRTPVSMRSRLRVVRSLASMALSNVLRLPSRTLLGSVGLTVGVGSLSFLLVVNTAFQGVLVGTLLGRAVSLQVRGVDLLSVVLAMCLAGLSVADVLFLNVHERSSELVTLLATGWSERHVRALIALEAAATGVIGAVPGSIVGAGLAIALGGFRPLILLVVTAAAVGGILVALLASIAPSIAAARMSPASALSAE